MAHEHDDNLDQNYYLDQLCTVGISGLLAGAGLLAWYNNIFDKFSILGGSFQLYVLIGSIGLLGLSVVRGVSLWVQVGQRNAAKPSHAPTHDHDHNHHNHAHAHGHAHDHEHDHGHDHDHGPDCDHDHAHDHGHANDHNHNHGPDQPQGDGHDHGFAPWRYAVLLLPLLLSALLLYYHYANLNLAFSEERLKSGLKPDGDVDAGGPTAPVKKDETKIVLLPEMTAAASSVAMREHWAGTKAILQGLYNPKNDKQCTLFRMKITCCASDMVTYSIRIIS